MLSISITSSPKSPQVANYGGDIIKFCGDAVMIIWPGHASASKGVQQVRLTSVPRARGCVPLSAEPARDHSRDRPGAGSKDARVHLHQSATERNARSENS